MRRWIERQRSLVDFTVSSLLRRRGKNLALLGVYALVVFVLGSVMLLSHALRHEAATILSEGPEIIVQRMRAGRHDTIEAARLDQLKELRGVAAAEGRLWGYYFDPGLKANYTLMVPPERNVAPGSAIIGSAVAEARRMDPGMSLFFLSERGKLHRFKVESVLSSDSELVAADLILVSEPDFRSFFGFGPDEYTDLGVRVRNPREIGTVSAKITRAMPDVRVVARDDLLRTYQAVFDWREGMVLVLVAGAVMAFAIFAWDKASGLTAEERREIGILKAVGWETGDVIRLKLWEGLLVSLIAFLFGYALAWLHVFHLDAALFAPALKGWAVLYPRFRLEPVVDGLQIASLFFFTVFPYTLATVVPIWRAATIDPDAAMR